MITPGQIYKSCQPTYISWDGKKVYTRIRVRNLPVSTPGLHGFGKVQVATITETGREVRLRQLASSQLHESNVTKTGQPRKTGYHLVEDVK